MKNLFAANKYILRGKYEQRERAIYFLKSDFKDLYRVYSDYGNCPLLTTYLIQLQGKFSILYLLNIITAEESRKLWNYTKLFAWKYHLTY